MDLLTAPAYHIRDRLLKRDMSSVELLDATLARIETVNPSINAVVAMNVDAARAAALQADMRLAAGEARPLEGLVVTVKDSLDVAGLPSTAGAALYRDRVPDVDADVVSRLRLAGAVILGKTNVPAFTADFQSYNAVYGVTNNPWDLSRSPGGSSGGAAAAVATGMSAFELGTDLGSSVRWPAHACGIFGLKTTWNLVPLWGHIPPSPERRMARNPDLMVAGPLARSADDLDLLLPIIAGPRNDLSVIQPLKAPRRLSAQGLRVAIWTDEPLAPVATDVSAAVHEAARRLGTGGAVVDSVRPVRFEEAFEVFSLLNHAIVAHSLPPKVRDRLQRAAAAFAPGDLSHRALQARGARMTPGLYQQVKARKQRLESLWARFFQSWDVVLCPPAPVLAIPHDHNPDFHARVIDVDGVARPYLDFLMWASPATSADLPAATVPVMRNAQGLPAGVQIIAAKGEDRTAIAVARILEELGCRYEAPPLAGSSLQA